jgi:hypothetical protein
MTGKKWDADPAQNAFLLPETKKTRTGLARVY